MRTGILLLIVALSGCGDTTGPVVEEQCRPAGPLQAIAVNGVVVDTSLIEKFEICPVRETYKLPQEVVNAGQ